MKPKTMILMGVAVVFGLAAAYLTNLAIAKNEVKITVLVAKDKLTRWTPLKNLDQQFEAREMSEKDLPKNVVKSDPSMVKEIAGRMLVRNLEKDQPLTLDDVQDKNKQGLEGELEKGRRAMAVRISPDSAVGGFVLPGSHVDVIHSIREGQRGAESKLILENVLVKAIDLLPVRPDDRPGMVGGTATLEVTPQEALKLSAVRDSGSLVLVLRPVDDKGKAEAPETDPKDLPPPPPAPPELKKEVVEVVATPAAPKPPEEEVVVMTIINGSTVSERVYYLDKDKKVKRSELHESAQGRASMPGMPAAAAVPGLSPDMLKGLRPENVPSVPTADLKKLPPLDGISPNN